MSPKNPSVDGFIEKLSTWKAEMSELRRMVLECGLTEDVKWGQPCFTTGGKNVVIIHGFKEYCALLFFKGSLMKDPEAILIQQTENVQGARQIRFTKLSEITAREAIIKAYIHEAEEIEKAGKKVEMKKTADYAVPDEFRVRLDADPALKDAFEALTPGRQRAYLYHFSQAKQSKTRESRVEACIPRIMDGLGMDD
jgi:uncharacterized protein YdeI (YjbR/CyaY-like superfamily)